MFRQRPAHHTSWLIVLSAVCVASDNRKIFQNSVCDMQNLMKLPAARKWSTEACEVIVPVNACWNEKDKDGVCVCVCSLMYHTPGVDVIELLLWCHRQRPKQPEHYQSLRACVSLRHRKREESFVCVCVCVWVQCGCKLFCGIPWYCCCLFIWATTATIWPFPLEEGRVEWCWSREKEEKWYCNNVSDSHS